MKATRKFVYAALFEPGDETGVVVSFPDIPEAITQGDSEAVAIKQAQESLGSALLTYPRRGLPVPIAKAKGRSLGPIAVAPEVAAKIAVLEAFQRSGLTQPNRGRASGRTRRKSAASSTRATTPS